MISSLLLCGGGEEPQHWVLMCTQWPGQPWTAPARDADAHQPINRSLHICSLQKLHGPPSTVQRWLSDLLHCPRYSTAPAKNQPPWKAAKKLQHCESRNKLGTCIIIAAIARISPAIFPPMCELFSTHAMRHRKAFTLPEPRQQNAPPPAALAWYQGNYSLQFLPSASFKLWPLWKLFFPLKSTVCF